MSEKIVLIDGHSILNRAFYGVPLLSNSSGLHTNAVYGFLNIMFKILEEEKPQYLAVAFDVKAKTFRHEMFAEYKGTRKPMPAELHEQVPVIKEVLQTMGILIMEQPGLEADDILGTMAKRAQSAGMEVALISGDRDLLQIADEHIKIRIPKTKGGGKTEVEDYYPADVVAKYQVNPKQFIELKALMGDTADNIPGVPKVGEKTATDLIVNFGSVAGVYEHIEEVTKPAIRKTLEENRDLAELSLKLATIEINAEIPFDIKDGVIGDFYNADAYALFQKLELKSFLNRFAAGVVKQDRKVEKITLSTVKAAKEEFAKAIKADHIGLVLLPAEEGETVANFEQLSLFAPQAEESKIIGLGFAYEADKIFWIAKNEEISESFLLENLQALAENKNGPVISIYDSKNAYPFMVSENLRKKSSKEISGRFFDILIGAYLLYPLKSDYTVEDIASEHLDRVMPTFKQEFAKMTPAKAYNEKQDALVSYYCDIAGVAYDAYDVLKEKLQNAQMLELFEETEMPLSLVLGEMEAEGVIVKPDELKAYGDELQEKIEVLEKRIHEAAGEDFNINSPKQLGEILFDKMALPGGKKTKTGYSTAADVLEGLAKEHPIVADVLEYRGLAKLKSTYADGLAGEIAEDGRIHTTFHQTITATGRISSTEPNLQNIPIRMEMGRLIRKVFVPKSGCVFMDADYSQIELRILAHMSEDEQLIEAYKSAEDIHRITASKVFHVPFEEVTALQRRNAKAVNFGIVYGISSFGLSQDLSISPKEAKVYIDEYFNTYPGIKAFLDKAVADAKKLGYSTTMFGRRRPIPELSSSNFMQRSFGERVAMNAPIQGTAADIMKIAMIRVRDRLAEENCKSKVLLQVHDELLLEVEKEEVSKVEEILRSEMENAAQLAVSLDVDLHTGDNWYETK